MQIYVNNTIIMNNQGMHRYINVCICIRNINMTYRRVNPPNDPPCVCWGGGSFIYPKSHFVIILPINYLNQPYFA